MWCVASLGPQLFGRIPTLRSALTPCCRPHGWVRLPPYYLPRLETEPPPYLPQYYYCYLLVGQEKEGTRVVILNTLFTPSSWTCSGGLGQDSFPHPLCPRVVPFGGVVVVGPRPCPTPLLCPYCGAGIPPPHPHPTPHYPCWESPPPTPILALDPLVDSRQFVIVLFLLDPGFGLDLFPPSAVDCWAGTRETLSHACLISSVSSLSQCLSCLSSVISFDDNNHHLTLTK